MPKALTGAVGKIRPSAFKRAKRGLQMYFGAGRYNVFKRIEKTRSQYAKSAARNVFVRNPAGAAARMQRLNRRMAQVVGVAKKKAVRHVVQRVGLGYVAAFGGLGASSAYLARRQKKRMAAGRARRKG